MSLPCQPTLLPFWPTPDLWCNLLTPVSPVPTRKKRWNKAYTPGVIIDVSIKRCQLGINLPHHVFSYMRETQRTSSPKGVRGNKSPTSHIYLFHYEIAACRSCCAGTLTIEEWKTEMLAEAVSVNSSETAKRNVWRDRSTSRVYSTECTLKQQ